MLAEEMAAKHWVTFSSRKGPQEPRSVAAKLLPEVGGRGGGGSPSNNAPPFLGEGRDEKEASGIVPESLPFPISFRFDLKWPDAVRLYHSGLPLVPVTH